MNKRSKMLTPTHQPGLEELFLLFPGEITIPPIAGRDLLRTALGRSLQGLSSATFSLFAIPKIGESSRIPAFYDLTQGRSEIVGDYNLVCPKCHRTGSYDRDEVEHYQHPDDSLAATA
ncbi:MAG: hypothetical protein ABI967_13775 [bacterium]